MKFLYTSVLAVALATLGLATPTSAATPPDSCFGFTAGTIIEYYSNEGNNIANPACSKDVDIPSTIAGQPVTSIGYTAFSGDQLTSVTIPNSVTSIGGYAFIGNLLTTVTIPNSITSIANGVFILNQLTSVSIPNSVTSIGSRAFANNMISTLIIPNNVTSIDEFAFGNNRLVSVTIPNSVTSLGYAAFALQTPWGADIEDGTNGAPHMYSSDPAEVQEVYDNIRYVRLYTEDPSNPNNLKNSIEVENSWAGYDANANGINDLLGGHIINPASINLSYVNQVDASLQITQTFTGFLNSEYINNYFVTQGPLIPIPADPENPTLGEQQAIDDALSAYYRLGDEVTVTPPAISGYITPPTQTFVLGAATNDFSYVYTLPSSSAGGGGTLANTGMSMITVAGLAIFAISMGLGSWLMPKRTRGIQL